MYEVDEDVGLLEICAVISTSCSECLPLNGFITLNITATNTGATSEQLCTYTNYGAAVCMIQMYFLTLIHTCVRYGLYI